MASTLEGRVALITGASKGLGRVPGRRFGQIGCSLLDNEKPSILLIIAAGLVRL